MPLAAVHVLCMHRSMNAFWQHCKVARSHAQLKSKLSLGSLTAGVPAAAYKKKNGDSMRARRTMRKTECEREEALFMRVSPVWRLRSPASSSASTCAQLT